MFEKLLDSVENNVAVITFVRTKRVFFILKKYSVKHFSVKFGIFFRFYHFYLCYSIDNQIQLKSSVDQLGPQ